MKVLILSHHKLLHEEALRIVVRADGVLQGAGRYQVTLRDVARSHDELTGVGRYLVGVDLKVAADGVHLDTLIDIARNGTVVIALFRQVLVIVERRLVAEQKGTLHVLLYRILIGRDGEEQFMETADVFPRFHRAVLASILTQCEHQGFSLVKHIDFLPLLLGKTIRGIDGIAADRHADDSKDKGIEPYLTEGGLDIGE
ncbi:hypothetical protein HMPREF0647_11620 [Prevotella bivia DNF00320]|uniref:Uncharacterized protein n=1 Tax=Prevotella bivia DNF00320 TaxID=1401068 RepID=A0A095ZZH8_9BACT|nr:hypothetical protein HMPREF0647_11620 [Prevotella bivia DNF00320]